MCNLHQYDSISDSAYLSCSFQVLPQAWLEAIWQVVYLVDGDGVDWEVWAVSVDGVVGVLCPASAGPIKSSFLALISSQKVSYFRLFSLFTLLLFVKLFFKAFFFSLWMRGGWLLSVVRFLYPIKAVNLLHQKRPGSKILTAMIFL